MLKYFICLLALMASVTGCDTGKFYASKRIKHQENIEREKPVLSTESVFPNETRTETQTAITDSEIAVAHEEKQAGAAVQQKTGTAKITEKKTGTHPTLAVMPAIVSKKQAVKPAGTKELSAGGLMLIGLLLILLSFAALLLAAETIGGAVVLVFFLLIFAGGICLVMGFFEWAHS